MSDGFTIALWIGLIALIIVGIITLDRIGRGLFGRLTKADRTYPHRVANQLPRVLHKGKEDEVLDLADDQDAVPK